MAANDAMRERPRGWVGTSGYSYREWRGSFYPEKLPERQMLRYYAERLNAVEINSTFYRMPTADWLEAWTSRVPEEFRFALKASRRITHQKGLRDVAEEMRYLVRTVSQLGEKLGPVLFQLPPWAKKDVPLLRDFLALLPDGFRAAFEFRDASWLDDEVYAALAERAAALVVADAGDAAPAPVVERTAAFGYARLRRTDYESRDLERWAGKLTAPGWDDVYVFFKHEEAGTGPRWAREFERVVSAG